ncbi:hypothetical protein [Clostridium sp.]|uniref:hypothetical protein n=1 Tax=Clostridium sp. TaxID=1506 RepID=UPI003F81112E
MILNNLKRLLQIKVNDYSKDELLSLVIELVIAKVKALCNIDEDNMQVLEEYDFQLLIAQIAADVYVSYNPNHTVINDEVVEDEIKPGGAIKSVTIGDYKVEYATESKSTAYTTTSLSDSLTFHLDKYDEELVNYRYLRFY